MVTKIEKVIMEYCEKGDRKSFTLNDIVVMVEGVFGDSVNKDGIRKAVENLINEGVYLRRVKCDGSKHNWLLVNEII